LIKKANKKGPVKTICDDFITSIIKSIISFLLNFFRLSPSLLLLCNQFVLKLHNLMIERVKKKLFL
ncbi:MAG: hypothetical protein RSD09_03640, partial [Bacilli bacterium]